MGFTTIATAAALALPKVIEAGTLREQSKQLNRAAVEQERLARRQAESMVSNALENQQRADRNAQARIGRARADAAASHLADDGSVRMREMDLATRLQDEITNNANATLQQAHAVAEQGAYTAWNTRNAAARARNQARGALLAGAGSMLGSFAGELSPSSSPASTKSKRLR